MKIVTEVHADSWNDDTYNEYVDKLQQLKNDIEAIGSENRKEVAFCHLQVKMER